MNSYQNKKSIKSTFGLLSFLLLTFTIVSCKNTNSNRNGKSLQLAHQNQTSFLIKRGINISHWLSQNPELTGVEENIFTENDIIFLSNVGFDHLRIPVDEEQLWDINGTKRPVAFQKLHHAFDLCQKYHLRVVLDLHIIRSHYFNNNKNTLWQSENEKQKFVQLWLDLSSEFKKYSTSFLAYELLNEALAEKASDWNNLYLLTITALRKTEPNRTIIIGSNMWQSPNTFHELVIPEKDTNIILSFHFYTPQIVTHYRAPWMDISQYNGEVNYPGQAVDMEELKLFSKSVKSSVTKYNGYFTRDTLLKLIQEPIIFSKARKLKLYCGEFGCMPTVRRSIRLQWYKDVRFILEQNNIAWANWDYRGGFSIFNQQTGMADENLINVLLDSITYKN